MRFKLFFTAFLLFVATGINAKIIDDSVSYSIGIQLAITLKQQGMLDKFEQNASFLEAFRDMRTEQSKMTLSDMERVLQKHFMAILEQEKAENGAAGKAFLEKNAQETGVVVLPSGLQYKILKKGVGVNPPKPTDMVEVHYKGSLVNGKVFESSYEQDKPIEFPLDQVIKGWTEGLQQITEGGKIMLFIPPDLAYGDQFRSGSPIGPNSTLIFEVELLKITQVEKNE